MIGPYPARYVVALQSLLAWPLGLGTLALGLLLAGLPAFVLSALLGGR